MKKRINLKTKQILGFSCFLTIFLSFFSVRSFSDIQNIKMNQEAREANYRICANIDAAKNLSQATRSCSENVSNCPMDLAFNISGCTKAKIAVTPVKELPALSVVGWNQVYSPNNPDPDCKFNAVIDGAPAVLIPCRFEKQQSKYYEVTFNYQGKTHSMIAEFYPDEIVADYLADKQKKSPNLTESIKKNPLLHKSSYSSQYGQVGENCTDEKECPQSDPNAYGGERGPANKFPAVYTIDESQEKPNQNEIGI